MRLVYFLVFSFLSLHLRAVEPNHLELAKQFDSLSGSQDKEKLVDSILPSFIPQNTNKAVNIDSLRAYLINILSSEEYALGKAKAYANIFSEEELELLIVMVQSPEYKLMQNKRHQINTALIKNMQELVLKQTQEYLDKNGN